MSVSNNELVKVEGAVARTRVTGALREARARACATLTLAGARLGRQARGLAREQEGQGTTEYAILVGVLVVIAILAIAAFRDRIQTLWTSISDAINGL